MYIIYKKFDYYYYYVILFNLNHIIKLKNAKIKK